VLATVIGHQHDKGWIIVDAGWMAMSRDRGTARLAVDQGYGVVCDLAGNPIPDLIMIDANQEHGILAARPGTQSSAPMRRRMYWPAIGLVRIAISESPRIGMRLRISCEASMRSGLPKPDCRN
jgi:D-serine deaminase-like pyridoxal phosphate-dependent protein